MLYTWVGQGPCRLTRQNRNSCGFWVFRTVEGFRDVESFLGYVCVCVCESVFTVASWGVESPYALSELKGPAVILPERNMEWDNGKDPSTPPKDKGDRDKRLKPYNQLTIDNGQAPVASRIRGIGERLSQPQPAQAINSTLLNTQLISLSCCSSTNHEKRRADAKTKNKRGGSKDSLKKCSEQMLFDQKTRTSGAIDAENVNCVKG